MCPDGATLESMSLIKSGNNLVANGKEFYHFRLRIRDRYGNMTSGGKIEIGYVTETRANQVDSLEMLEYPISFLGSAVIHS